MLRITVLGAVAAPRDALATALTLHAATTGATHLITTEPGGDLTLLLGLSRSDALQGSAANLADDCLRNRLNDARQPYQVLYGMLNEQLAQAVRILHVHQQTTPCDRTITPPQPKTSLWRWACDKCSDPACEHKLLTDLLAQRACQA